MSPEKRAKRQRFPRGHLPSEMQLTKADMENPDATVEAVTWGFRELRAKSPGVLTSGTRQSLLNLVREVKPDITEEELMVIEAGGPSDLEDNRLSSEVFVAGI